MIHDLLKRWCDGMIAVQIVDTSDPTQHGALGCPACGFIHGRCMDAVYPLFRMAKSTGDPKYLEAGKAVFEWSQNVSQPDGSWTVMPDPKTWKGITVFGAIALAETLHFHGDLLDPATRDRWTERLARAAKYVFENFDLHFANVNYGFTAIYALHLIGHHLDEPRYIARSRELANEAKRFFTYPNQLIYGEAKPTDRRSDRGLLSVDLGYNVEESLNGIVLYALAEKDEELLALLDKSLAGHLEFMLPDGGWDNSWGSRQFKWTYWGSRTSDGCLPAYALMGHRHPAFATAAFRNTELLRRCTSDTGLLYGGIHYEQHALAPCVHHTFAHAKPLALMIDSAHSIEQNDADLPRSQTGAHKDFPEIATKLAARGPWRATVTAYDFIYRPGVQQATGGALSLLWHQKTGPLLAASMANYLLVEPYNQQPDPDEEDFPFTPRLERTVDGKRYTNLFDLKATITANDTESETFFDVSTNLNNSQYHPLPDACSIRYTIAADAVNITAVATEPTTFVLPILSPSTERVTQPNPNRIEIQKAKCTIGVESDSPLKIRSSKRDRVFNRVPGAQAIPVEIDFSPKQPLKIILSVS